MRTAALSLREARTYASLATLVALVTSTGLGAVTTPLLGAAVALAAVGGSLATVRAYVTCPQDG
jgi:hypothetical protein